jgi:hypothetical protein
MDYYNFAEPVAVTNSTDSMSHCSELAVIVADPMNHYSVIVADSAEVYHPVE